MPEGPEIHRVADQLADALEGQRVDDVFMGLPRLAPFAPRLCGRRILSIEPRGKALLTRFEGDLVLYSHNQLYGRWYVKSRGKLPRTRRALRVALHTKTRSALLYSATDIELLSEEQLSAHPFLTRIGPDILAPETGWRAIAARLDERRFRGRSLGSLYLDQSFIAGIGNYLRSEILFSSGLHPARKPRELTGVQRNTLARHTLEIARRSYETGGITITPRLLRDLKSRGWRRAQYRFGIFGREGKACHACGSAIERITVGSRRLYLCPKCQH